MLRVVSSVLAEELGADHGGQRAVQIEVIPLEHRAERGRQDYLLLARGHRPHNGVRIWMFRLHRHVGRPSPDVHSPSRRGYFLPVRVTNRPATACPDDRRGMELSTSDRGCDAPAMARRAMVSGPAICAFRHPAWRRQRPRSAFRCCSRRRSGRCRSSCCTHRTVASASACSPAPHERCTSRHSPRSARAPRTAASPPARRAPAAPDAPGPSRVRRDSRDRRRPCSKSLGTASMPRAPPRR